METALGETPEIAEAARQLAEAITSTRLVLRRALAQALEVQRGARWDNRNVKEYVRLAEVYGKGSSRLARLLSSRGSQKGRLAAYAVRLPYITGDAFGCTI